VQICTPLKRVDAVIANDAGVSARQVSKVETILKEATSELKQRVLTGKTAIDKAYNSIKAEEKREQLIQQAKEAARSLSSNHHPPYELFEGDFREVGKEIKPNSVDLVFVDSLYYEWSLPLHEHLAELAEQVLKPGGSYAVYIVPQWKESTIRGYVTQNSNLKECGRWIVELQGPYGSDHNMHMMYQSKIIGWFCKGDKPINPLFESGKKMFDIIRSRTPDKQRSKYTQSEIEADYIIRNLTAPHDLVLDPMMGEGTTGVATLKLRRRFIGIEIDAQTFELAKANLTLSLSPP